MKQYRAHAVVVPSTGFGHLNPALELSRQLVLRGVEVTLVIFEEHIAAARKRVASDVESVRGGIRLVGFPEPLRGDNPSQPIAALAQIIRALEPRPRCLISDNFVKCQDAADELGIPRVVLWTAATLSEHIFASVPLLVSGGYIPVEGSPHPRNADIGFLPGLPVNMALTDLPLCFHAVDRNFAPHSETCTENASRAQGFLGNTIEEIESEVIAVQRSQLKRYFPVGPLLLPEITTTSSGEEHYDPVLKWLDSQSPRSVLYVGFGSESSLPKLQFDALVDGLAASKVPLVWSLRRNLVPDAGTEVYEAAAATLATQGKVVEWVPQRAILEHSSVAAFVTHGGWNSTLEALCAGVPTLCWPFGAEQNINTLLMTRKWEVGVDIADGPESDVSAEEIARLIGDVMHGERGKALRDRAVEMKSLALAATKPGGSSYNNMNDFVKSYLP